MDFYVKAQVQQSLYEIDKILKTGVFDRENIGSPLMRSAFTSLLINLRNLMWHCWKLKEEISWTDDVQVDGEVKNVSMLIKYVRDAMCHPDSENHYHNSSYLSFNVAVGKSVVVRTADLEQSSDYEDDMAFCFGPKRIYMKRHILRSLDEAKEIFIKHGIIDKRPW